MTARRGMLRSGNPPWPVPDLYTFPGFAPASVKVVGDDLVIEGWLVRFSDENSPDLSGEYFTKSTDFGPLSDLGEIVVASHYDHGMDAEIGRERLGLAHLKMMDEGVWARHQIKRRVAYLRALDTAAKGEGTGLGQSSGSAAHVADRGPKGRARPITYWPLVEASITPTPCEPTTGAVVKSITVSALLTSIPDGSDAPTGSDDVAGAIKALATINASLTLTRTLREMNAQLLPLL